LYTIGTPFLWITFIILSMTLIIIDIWLQNKKNISHQPLRLAIFFSLLWLCVTFLFSLILWIYLYKSINYHIANSMTIAFINSYLLEQCLAIDNVFIWLLLFKSFNIPIVYQRTVLTFGILGAIIFRILIISTGIWLFSKIKWILYILGCILVFTGIKIILYKEIEQIDLKNNKLFLWCSKKLRITKNFSEKKFFFKKNGILFFTPLFIVLIMIECSDLIFAIDSISAVFSITMNIFIIMTSNLLAVFSLRSMYFFLFLYTKIVSSIKYGIGIILIYIGFKIFIEHLIYIPQYLSLLIIGSILGLNIMINYFLIYKKK